MGGSPGTRLATFLAPEIQQGLVTVQDSVDRSLITIIGDGLFAKGSGTISDRYQPLIDRIGDELSKVPGLVKVTGHTDNQPIRSLRFPSNFHLSQERARSVGNALAARMGGTQRITAEGRADSEPVAPNDSEPNRARNRRVEITLLVAPAAAAPAPAPATTAPATPARK